MRLMLVLLPTQLRLLSALLQTTHCRVISRTKLKLVPMPIQLRPKLVLLPIQLKQPSALLLTAHWRT